MLTHKRTTFSSNISALFKTIKSNKITAQYNIIVLMILYQIHNDSYLHYRILRYNNEDNARFFYYEQVV